MNLAYWIKLSGIASERELARRCGYDSNGLISLIKKGTANIPLDDVVKWADALELHGENREKFIAEAEDTILPKWHLDRIESLRLKLAKAQQQQALAAQQHVLLLKEVARLNANLGKKRAKT